MDDTRRLVYSPAEVRRLDRIAIDEFSIPGFTLMQRAAYAACEEIRSTFPDARRWLVLCGAGNNAGDGYLVADLARRAGQRVRVAALADPDRLSGDAATARDTWLASGGQIETFSEPLFDSADLAVDALLGTGLDRPLEGPWRRAVEALNHFSRTGAVIALDVPTGLDASTGRVLGVAVRAQLTVTFVGLKTGLFTGAGPAHAGAVHFAGLGVPPEARARVQPAARLFDPAACTGLLEPRDATAHKGQFGHVLVLGGNYGMAGAVRLAGEAALRTGAGLVSIGTRAEHAAAITAARPELMVHALPSAAELEPLLERASVIAIGPGLGRDAWAQAVLERALAASLPLVVDADALNLVAAAGLRGRDWILTPHPGEAGRLLGRTAAAVQEDRLGALAALVDGWRGVVLLKGRCTLVGSGDGLPWVIDRGNPGMASAGMGDVLTGILAGLLAQFPDAPRDLVAASAAWLHAAAGDSAAGEHPRGLLALDLIDALRPWLNPVR